MQKYTQWSLCILISLFFLLQKNMNLRKRAKSNNESYYVTMKQIREVVIPRSDQKTALSDKFILYLIHGFRIKKERKEPLVIYLWIHIWTSWSIG